MHWPLRERKCIASQEFEGGYREQMGSNSNIYIHNNSHYMNEKEKYFLQIDENISSRKVYKGKQAFTDKIGFQ